MGPHQSWMNISGLRADLSEGQLAPARHATIGPCPPQHFGEWGGALPPEFAKKGGSVGDQVSATVSQTSQTGRRDEPRARCSAVERARADPSVSWATIDRSEKITAAAAAAAEATGIVVAAAATPGRRGFALVQRGTRVFATRRLGRQPSRGRGRAETTTAP